jgi:hypothetical protein
MWGRVGDPNTEAPSAAPVCSGPLVAVCVPAYISGVDDELETERSQHLVCEECGCESDVFTRGWEGHLGIEDDDSVSLVFFCPECVDELRRDA